MFILAAIPHGESFTALVVSVNDATMFIIPPSLDNPAEYDDGDVYVEEDDPCVYLEF